MIYLHCTGCTTTAATAAAPARVGEVQNIHFRTFARLPRLPLQHKFLVVVAIIVNLKHTKFGHPDTKGA